MLPYTKPIKKRFKNGKFTLKIVTSYGTILICKFNYVNYKSGGIFLKYTPSNPENGHNFMIAGDCIS